MMMSPLETPVGGLAEPLPLFAATDMAVVFGSLRPTGPALSIDDMNAAITEEASRCSAFVTFDQKLAKRAKSLKTIPVVNPE